MKAFRLALVLGHSLRLSRLIYVINADILSPHIQTVSLLTWRSHCSICDFGLAAVGQPELRERQLPKAECRYVWPS